MILFHTTDRPGRLDEREGLTHYLTNTIDRPDALTEAEYQALPANGRAAYDRARIRYLSGGILIHTPQLQKAKTTIKRLLAENLGRNSGHSGLMLSGASTLGKTTTAKALMRYVHSMYRRQFPTFAEHGHVPVVYVEVPAGSTGKLLMSAFARFFGITIAPRDTMDSIKNRVVTALNTANTQLVVVDELHNLNASNRANGETIDMLKALHNQVPATFVYAGIELASAQLLSGPRGQQLSARFTKMDLPRFNFGHPVEAAQWAGIVKKFEDALPLSHHTPGTLLRLSPYLYERTNGSIGSLGKLITSTAIGLIMDEDPAKEAITQDLLDEQVLDIAAEESYANARTRTATSRKGK